MGAVYIVAFFFFVGIVVMFAIYYSNAMKMTSYINGQVLSAEDRVVRDERERREETHLVCTYQVRGKDYTIEHTLRGLKARAFPPGSPIVVWYNPTTPDMARIKLV